MKLLPLLFTFLFISLSFSQQQKVDSLIALLNQKPADTVLLNTYYHLVSHFSNNDIFLAEKYLDTMLNLAKSKNLNKYVFTGGSLNGILSFRQGKFEEGIEKWKNTLKNTKIDDFPIQKSNLYNNIAVGYKVAKNTDSVIRYMHKSINLNEQLNNNAGLVANYYSLSDFYSSIQENDSSIAYLMKLKNVALKTNDQVALARMYILLANISRKENDFDDSIIQFDKALKIYEAIDKDNMVMRRGLEFEIINSNIKSGNFDIAIQEIIHLKNTYYRNDYADFWRNVDTSLLGCYNEIGNTIDGQTIYNKLKAIEITDDLISTTHLKLCLSHYELITKSFSKETIQNLKEALKTASNHDEKKQVYKLISDYYYLNGNPKNAYTNLIESNKYLDSLNNDMVLKTNLSLKRKFNEELKDKENLQLKAEKAEQAELIALESKRKWQMAGGLAIAFVGLGVFGFYYQRNKKQKTLIENLQKELHHRVKNNLAIIDTFIEVVKDEFENEAIDTKLTELQNRIDSINEVHKQLYTSKDITNLNLKKYINTLANNVQQSFHTKGITVEQSVAENLQISPEKSFPMGLIINEFITNSYKYAFNENGGEIKILLKETANKINLSLSDNGKGLANNFSVENANTFGIRIMKLLTEQLKGSFHLTSDNGVKLLIEFPKS